MRKLTKIVIPAMAALAAIGTAGAASAQPYPDRGFHDHGYPGRPTPVRADMIRQQLDDLAQRVNRNDRRDHISGREAAGLRRDIQQTRQQFRWFNRDGLDQREMRILQSRIDTIRTRLHMERVDWNGHRD